MDTSKVGLFVMFIGYPRSGHSLVGSIIDAHPHAAISHELDVLQFLKNNKKASLDSCKEDLFQRILANTVNFNITGRKWNGYSYMVPGMSNGDVSNVTVIGDKKGGRTTGRLIKQPSLMGRLRAVIGNTPIKFIHGVRNPYDNISSIYKRDNGKRKLDKIMEIYNRRALYMQQFKADNPGVVFDVHNEDLISDPGGTIQALMDFLGLETTPEYIEACSSIVLPAPRKVRNDITWAKTKKDRVRIDSIQKCDFLTRYTFDG